MMRLSKFIFGLCFIAMHAGATPPPIPARPWIDNIQALPDGALFAMVGARGLYRRAAGGEWKQLIKSQGMGGWTQIYARGGNELLLSAHISGAVYRSRDGGLSWAEEGAASAPYAFRELGMSRAENYLARTAQGRAYMLYRDTVFMSGDGGITWSENRIPAMPEPIEVYRQSLAANDEELFVMSGRTLFHSKDQGRHWQAVEQTDPNSPILTGIAGSPPELHMAPDGTLLALGNIAVSQRAFASRDGGRHWEEQRFGLPPGAAFVLGTFGPDPDAMYFFIRGAPINAPTFTTVYRRGLDGNLSEMGIGPNLSTLTRSVKGKIYALEFSRAAIHESSDGGKTWSPVPRDVITWY